MQSREDYYSQERQSAGRKFVIPFFDEDYEITTTEESQDYIFIPQLSNEQLRANETLLSEINNRVKYSLEDNRTPKSRWHHRQIIRLRLRELQGNLK